jgi:hypothetical protein
VRPEQYGIVANRNELRQPASQHHGRTAEGGDKATEAAASGKATEAESGGKRSCIPLDLASHSNAIGTANRAKAGGCARSGNGEDCRAGKNVQQLHRWLPDKLQVRQPTVEWMLRVVRGFYFINNVQKRTQLQDLPGVQGDRNVSGLETI